MHYHCATRSPLGAIDLFAWKSFLMTSYYTISVYINPRTEFIERLKDSGESPRSCWTATYTARYVCATRILKWRDWVPNFHRLFKTRRRELQVTFLSCILDAYFGHSCSDVSHILHWIEHYGIYTRPLTVKLIICEGGKSRASGCF